MIIEQKDFKQRSRCKLILTVVVLLLSLNMQSQELINDSLRAKIVTAYESNRFSGARVFQKDSISQFLVVCVQLEKGKFDTDTRNTIAEARAKKSANSFVNGDHVQSETLFVLDEYSNSKKAEFHEERFSERLRIFSQGTIRGVQNIYYKEEGADCIYLYVVGQQF
jgi:hypothetical protein